MRTYLITALIALVCGFAGAAAWSLAGLGNERTRDYLVANPQILPEMAQAYQRQEAQARLGELGPEARRAFPGAVLGNPNGTKVLVEFTDYGCTYCRMSVAVMDEMIRSDPDLKVVVHEWPIFDGSEDAARMGLAAARQGRYAAFYRAMFELGPPSAQTIAAAAAKAGLDLAEARRFAASDEASAEIARVRGIASQLGFTGTPSWIAGDQIVEGFVESDRLSAALEGGAT